MKISEPKEKYIFIELNRSDMEKLHLSYDEMDYSNADTRMAIYSVLSEAKASLGQNFELSDTMRVEALPREDGGCFLFFTINSKTKRYLYCGKESEMVFAFDNIDNLIDFSTSLSDKERNCISSALYSEKRKYYLLVSGKLHHSIVMKLCEYAYPLKNDEKPILSWKRRIINENALEILCGGISE